jgi:integrase
MPHGRCCTAAFALMDAAFATRSPLTGIPVEGNANTANQRVRYDKRNHDQPDGYSKRAVAECRLFKAECIVSALRFFFTHTIDRPDLARKLIRAVHPRNLPVVLSRDEVARLLYATTCLKHQAALSVAYGAGLRVAEVAALKVTDVDSERMLLRVERGKGGRYRNAMLPADLLTLLRGGRSGANRA